MIYRTCGGEPHYEFDQELKEKLAATRRNAAREDAERVGVGVGVGGEREREERHEWMTVLSEPGPDTRVNGIVPRATETER